MLLRHVRIHPLGTLRRLASSNSVESRKIDRLLIANRGEIALRVMKTSHAMGIETVAVYSDADAKSLHTKSATFAYHIGEPSPLKSYLRMEKIIDVALRSRAQAIHPGYGFLSENPEFADLCDEAGIIFIGPPAQAIRDMGMKNTAKKIMIAAGVPVIEGYNGDDQSKQRLFDEASRIGFPVMMKAVRGGGGKGMRIARTREDFFAALESAQTESSKAFGDTDMIIEKFVERPRHVEVQVFGDKHDNYVYLFERDCSIQRRHQKIIEEAPAPGLTAETRARLGQSAVAAARAVNYVGAGTVEFIMDERGDFYFMEMNTRLQVEHPVSEAITGIDLVEWQIRAAQGDVIPKQQEDIKLQGHAMEARVYAEDTEAGFIPTAGRLEHLSFPSTARIDSGVVQGDDVTVHYDPMIAKVIVHGANRTEAITRLDRALASTHIGGLCNNVDFVRTCLNHPEFIAGRVYTDFIADHESELMVSRGAPTDDEIIEGAVGQLLVRAGPQTASKDPFGAKDFFRLNYSPVKRVALGEVTVDVQAAPNQVFKVKLPDHEVVSAKVIDAEFDNSGESQAVTFTLEVSGHRRRVKAVQLTDDVAIFGVSHRAWPAPREVVFNDASAADVDHEARAPMPGVIDKVLVAPGDTVSAGQPLIVMIAMKMEYVIKASKDCVIDAVQAGVGSNVAKNAILVKFTAVDAVGASEEGEKRQAAATSS